MLLKFLEAVDANITHSHKKRIKHRCEPLQKQCTEFRHSGNITRIEKSSLAVFFWQNSWRSFQSWGPATCRNAETKKLKRINHYGPSKKKTLACSLGKTRQCMHFLDELLRLEMVGA